MKSKQTRKSTKPVLTPEESFTRRRLTIVVVGSIVNVFAAAIWLMVGPGALWTGYLLIAIGTTWAFFYALQYRARRQIGLGLSFFALILVLAFYWNFAVEQNQGFSAFLKSSPCGQSSCSHQTNQDTYPYNAAGFLPSIFGETSSFSIKLTFCFCKGCMWASNNAGNLYGYPAINGTHLPDTSATPIANGGLATTNPANYQNGALGLARGVNPGAGSTVSNIVFCPGVSMLHLPNGVVGQAYVICAGCLNELRKQTGFTDPLTDLSCPPSLYPPWTSGMCWLCPDPATCPYLIVITWVLFELTIVVGFNWVAELVFR
jgi:hypothetical protein